MLARRLIVHDPRACLGVALRRHQERLACLVEHVRDCEEARHAIASGRLATLIVVLAKENVASWELMAWTRARWANLVIIAILPSTVASAHLMAWELGASLVLSADQFAERILDGDGMDGGDHE